MSRETLKKFLREKTEREAHRWEQSVIDYVSYQDWDINNENLFSYYLEQFNAAADTHTVCPGQSYSRGTMDLIANEARNTPKLGMYS